MPFRDYSSTPASNAAINGIGVAEGMLRANVNNAIRQLMADAATFASGFGVPLADITGATDTIKLQTALAASLPVIQLPARTIEITAKLVPIAPVRFVGQGRDATDLYFNVNDYGVETLVTGRKVEGENFTVRNNTANAAGGLFNLFDNAGYSFKRVNFEDSRKEALRFVQGVQIQTEDCIFNNCAEPYTSAVTITNATPGVVTWNAHGQVANTVVILTTTGTLPTGLSPATVYYVRNPTTNTFELSLTSGGASIATSSAGSGTHTAYAVPYAAVFADPGATASVQVGLRGGYISSCGIGFKANTNRVFNIDNVTFEGNVLGIKADSSDGYLDTRYFESNIVDGDLIDCAGLEVGTPSVGSNFAYRWSGAASKDRAIKCERPGYAFAYTNDTFTAGSTAWTDVTMETLGDHYQVTCAVTAAPVTVDHKGIYDVDYGALFLADASARVGAIRLVADTGSGYAEVPGSWRGYTFAASESKTIEGKVRVNLSAAASVKLQYSVSNVALTIAATGITGPTAPTHATTAWIDIKHSGTEK